jgi:hypothetical protein
MVIVILVRYRDGVVILIKLCKAKNAIHISRSLNHGSLYRTWE